jgi:hypothetical protein
MFFRSGGSLMAGCSKVCGVFFSICSRQLEHIEYFH